MALRHNSTVVPVDATIRFLITACGPCLLAFSADWIRGILTQEEAGFSPTVLSAGVAYPVTSLADRLRIPSGTNSVDTRLILCGNGTWGHAFIVDRVLELIDVDRTAPRPLPTHFHGSERTKLSGYLMYQDTMVLIVNTLWLLETGVRMDRPQQRTTLPQLETSGGPHHVPGAQRAVGQVQ
jgi:hypothetical protein